MLAMKIKFFDLIYSLCLNIKYFGFINGVKIPILFSHNVKIVNEKKMYKIQRRYL